MGGLVSLPSPAPVRLYTRPSVPADILVVADNMRQADRDEVKAGLGCDPRETLAYCFFLGKPCMTVVGRSGEPVALWGVVPDGKYPEAGRIWLLGTDDLVEDSANRVRFLKESKKELALIETQYQVLFNFMDARNVVHRRWLRWMGFTFIAEHPNYGAEGRLFLEFCKVSHV